MVPTEKRIAVILQDRTIAQVNAQVYECGLAIHTSAHDESLWMVTHVASSHSIDGFMSRDEAFNFMVEIKDIASWKEVKPFLSMEVSRAIKVASSNNRGGRSMFGMKKYH